VAALGNPKNQESSVSARVTEATQLRNEEARVYQKKESLKLINDHRAKVYLGNREDRHELV
jgi:hypothetical protein